ncbi:retention module-containing protein [Halomonas ramblicola]|uniref:retention module-containing protein n=1 Tax=Halomonas ramblicola TaxID=747349 RepID=UPI0025B30DCF|nr:retention module-containing protein [Halomonas ramblicola]MDN3521042.1 retention module-containing protein [Halomonas ramblicola]
MAIATVIAITGQAWARDAQGNLHELRVGDTLAEGEVLVTADNARVELDFGDGLDPTLIQGGQEVAMTPELSADEAVTQEEASALDEDLEALLTAIDEGEGDLLEELDATAAGAGPGGAAGGGHSFVMLGHITEQVSSLSFDYGLGQLESGDFPENELTALAVEEEAALAVEEEEAPNSLPSVATADLDGDMVWESALAGGSGGGTDTTTGSFQIDTGDDGLALIEVQDRDGNWTAITADGTAVAGEYGTLTVNPDGSWSYTLDANTLEHDGNDATGTADQVQDLFGVRVTDDDGDVSPEVTLTLDVNDDGPVARDDNLAGEVAEDGSVDIDVFANDTAGADGVDLAGGIAVASGPSQGSVVYNGDGTFTYTAAPGAEGADSFTYTLTDADGDTAMATVGLTIVPDSVPSLPVVDAEGGNRVDEAALDDGSNPSSTAESTSGTFNVTHSGADTTASLVIAGVDVTSGGTVNGTYGTLEVRLNGGGVYEWAYTLTDNTTEHPDDASTGTSEGIQDVFEVTVTDSDGDTADTRMTIDVLDDGPVAVVEPASALTEGDSAIGGDLLANDTEGADGATVTHVDLGSGFVALGYGTDLGGGDFGFSVAGIGDYVFNADGSWGFTPADSVDNGGGDVDASFSYRIIDGDGDADEASKAISIADGGDPQDAAGIMPTVDEDDLAGGSDSTKESLSHSGTLSFTLGSDALVSMAFSTDLSGLITDTDGIAGDEVVWARNGDTEIVGQIGGVTAITLSLSSVDLAAGTAQVTATLANDFKHLAGSGENNLDLGSVNVVATDSDGDTAVGAVTPSVVDDVPSINSVQNAVVGFTRPVGVGQIDFVAGADGSGGFDLSGNGDGDPENSGYEYNYSEGGSTLTATWASGPDSGETHFTLHVDASGAYRFEVIKPPAGKDITLDIQAVDSGKFPNGVWYDADTGEWGSDRGAINGDVDLATEAEVKVTSSHGINSSGAGTGFGNNHLNPGEDVTFEFLDNGQQTTTSHATLGTIRNAGNGAMLVAYTAIGAGDVEETGYIYFDHTAEYESATIEINDFEFHTLVLEAQTSTVSVDASMIDNVDGAGTYSSDATAKITLGQVSYHVGETRSDQGFDFAVAMTDGDDDVSNAGQFSVHVEADDPTEGEGYHLDGTAGADVLIGTAGDDIMSSGLGADTFAWNFGDEGAENDPAEDTVMDFTLGDFGTDADADKLDISDLLQGAGFGSEDIDDYILARESGSDTMLHIKHDGGIDNGDGSNADQTILLKDVGMDGNDSSTFIQSLIDSGQLDIE